MTNNSKIGKLGLECLMSRANIIFTSGYRFTGKLDTNLLQQSFTSIVDKIEKFSHKIEFESQQNYQWQSTGPFKQRFLVVESDDIEDEFKTICSRSFELMEQSNFFPMIMVVILDKNSSSPTQDFIIVQLSEHTYVDAGSSEVIFNKIIAHYNALTEQNHEKAREIHELIQNLKTIDTKSMVKLLEKDHCNHEENAQGLASYPVADIGEYKIPLEDVPQCLEEYKKRIRIPTFDFYDIDKLLKSCREHNPEVSRNSITCAAIAKAIYNINVKEKGKDNPEEHLISMKMLSNLLPEDLKQSYSGNYISFVPVTVNGHKSIEEIACDIQERVNHFKQTQTNLSLYDLVENAVQAGVVGKSDDELSIVVTNWNNYSFLNDSNFLADCKSIRHYCGVNIDPKDTLGGVLVNRPVMALSLSPDGQLCISHFPSLRSEQENQQIAKHLDKVIHSY